ncbi:MAG: hypothetical protein PHD81_02135 [Candidatus Nanoarchaeia archaeon]|nr:hypothetical protein [Candidatus Nanoarchaeia archaeon]MDD5587889.1 hypothetical protein [Candidatus Nanoarchaeia archaeon]
MATLMDMGLLNYFLPIFTFLFIFAALYALLDKTKILGDNSALKFIAAFSVAMITLFTASITDLINYVIPWFVFIAIFLILLFGVLMHFGIKEENIWNNLSMWTVMIIAFLILLIGLTQVFGDVFTPYQTVGNTTKTISSETLRTLFHPRTLGAIFMLIIASLTVRFVGHQVGGSK